MKDARVASLIRKEEKRIKKVINLIASENCASNDVQSAVGSVFSNKYAEGYVGRRYYGGNAVVDEIETLCKERALDVYHLSHKKWAVNVQPLSGSPANFAVYSALLPHDGTGKIMGMCLSHGGHLTHGHNVSMTGKFWKQISYGVSRKTELLDYDELMEIALREKPNIIVAGFTAYPRKINWKKFRAIAHSVGALLMVDMSHIAGLVAGGVYPSPFPYADIVTTTTHKTLRGPRGAMIFARKDERDLVVKIDKAVFPGLQGGPHIHTITGIAVALHEAGARKFQKYTKQVLKNAQVMSQELTRLGWRVVTGGTDSHLLLVDTWNNGTGVSGKVASEMLEQAGIIVNMNTIPFDTRSPRDPSGIRIGTAYETSRGMKEKEMIRIANKIDLVLRGNV
jgi:glycine hydroxymethyltransferase